jgi:hypothetical protein
MVGASVIHRACCAAGGWSYLHAGQILFPICLYLDLFILLLFLAELVIRVRVKLSGLYNVFAHTLRKVRAGSSVRAFHRTSSWHGGVHLARRPRNSPFWRLSARAVQPALQEARPAALRQAQDQGRQALVLDHGARGAALSAVAEGIRGEHVG